MASAPSSALSRRLGLAEATLAGIGVTLGAGIYSLVGEAAGIAGNAVWLSFVVAAVMATLTGLSYAELASAYPRAGADYQYARQGLGTRAGFVIGWLVILSNLVGAAAVALGFAGYLRSLLAADEVLIAACAIVACSGIAFIGVREAVWFSIVLTIVEAGGLVFIIVVGLPDIGQHDLVTGARLAPVFSGAALVTFAFIGFGQIASLAEETRDPTRVIPRAMVLSIAITAVLYVLVAIAATSTIGAGALAASDAALADVAAAAIGDRAHDLIAVVALFSTFNTILLLLMASSRMIYGMASGENAVLPGFMAGIHHVRRTPGRAIAACLVVALSFVISGDLGFVAGASNFAVFVAFAGINLTLVVLRYRSPRGIGPFRVPGQIGRIAVVPVVALAVVVVLLAYLERDAILVGTGLLVLGIAIAQGLHRSWWQRRTGDI